MYIKVITTFYKFYILDMPKMYVSKTYNKKIIIMKTTKQQF